MASITITQLHTLLSQKLGKDTAENLTTFILEKIKEGIVDNTKEIATKDFVKSEIANLKIDMIKWFVGLFIILAGMIIGLYFRRY